MKDDGKSSLVIKDDRTSSVIQDDGSSSSTEDERDFKKAQQRNRRSPGSRRKSPPPQTGSSSSEEEEPEEVRRSSRRWEKTRGNAQVETDTGQTVYTQVEPETAQTAYIQVEPDMGQTTYTPRWQKTGSAMQIESRDPRSHSIQTACIPTGSNVQIEPTDVPVHPGQTAHLPTGSSMQLESTIQTACTPPSLTTQRQDRLTALPSLQLKRTALLSLQLKTTSMPDEDSARPAGHTVARQQEEEMAVEKELSAPQLAAFVDRFLPEQQVHDFRPKLETEIQRPEKRLCDQYNDAYGAYHYRPSFYSPPGYTQCVYPNGVQHTPFPEIQRFSRPYNTSYAYPYGVPCPSQEVEIRQVAAA